MNFTGMMKQLRKRLRLNRRWLSLGSVGIIVGASLVLYTISLQDHNDSSGIDLPTFAAAEPVSGSEVDEAVMAQLAEEGKGKKVSTVRTYVCGEEIEQLGVLSPQEIRSLHAEHPQWQVSLDGDSVVMREQIEDLSPKCKDTAYFGLDKSGNLSLFDGEPAGDKVIRTFFQLNMGFLESSLPRETVNQLREGIRVTDMLEYNSVLSTFSDFAEEQ